MIIKKMAAFSIGGQGGNPAGVVVSDHLPSAAEMQHVARQVGFSETVFAVKQAKGEWTVRYHSPDAEIPFCGHATIALGAVLAMDTGESAFRMHLAKDIVDVEGRKLTDDLGEAAFLSPPSSSRPVGDPDLQAALELFSLERDDLFSPIAPAVIEAGASHLLLPLKRRETLGAMRYDFARGQALTRAKQWVTVLLAWPESATRFHARNAFAYGGVYEDPATGAAAAALAGYLRAGGYAPSIEIVVFQGDHMRVPCQLHTTTPAAVGGRVRVSGTARRM